VQTAAGRPAAQPAHHQGIGAEGEGTRLPLPAPGGYRPKRQGERCSNEGKAVHPAHDERNHRQQPYADEQEARQASRNAPWVISSASARWWHKRSAAAIAAA